MAPERHLRAAPFGRCITELFPAYRGTHVEISESLNLLLVDAFSHLCLLDHYRVMDAWLEANPRKRPRNLKRFVVNWLQRQPKPSLKELQIQKELLVGRGPVGPREAAGLA